MREYHTKAHGIPEYINMLEDAQKQAEQIDEDNPITDKSLLTIAAAAMLKTGQFPEVVREWEKLLKDKRTWDAWKKTFKKAKTAAANAATSAPPGFSRPIQSAGCGSEGGTSGGEPDSTMIVMVEKAFNNLANVVSAERGSFDEMLKSLAAISTNNAELVKITQQLAADVRRLEGVIKTHRGGGGGGGKKGDGKKEKKKPSCSICKGKGAQDRHKTENCWEKPENAANRPSPWSSVL